MRKFKLPQNVSDLSSLIIKMRTDASNKLSKFCTQQILDKRLSTKTFNYEFDISGSRSGAQRKSVQKLKEILYKHVKKQIPYLEYIRGGEQFLFPLSNRPNGIGIKLESPYFPVTVSRLEPSFADVASDSLKWKKSIERYCRFLRYKAIKNGIPISLSPGFEFSIHPEDEAAYETWWKTRSGEATFRVKAVSTVKAELVIYQFANYAAIVTSAPELSITSYEEYQKHIIKEGDETTIRRFKDPDRWTASPLTSRSRVEYYPGLERYSTSEKIFTVLDEMIKVITTFTRRVQYDTSAFNVGSVETT